MEQKTIKIKEIEVNKGQIEGLPKNPRFIRDERFDKLKKSIEEAPEMLALRELIVYPHNRKYVIIAGNMRFRACKDLGYKEIPCKVLDADTPVEKLREYTIKDNVAFGQDDFDLLANEWDIQELDDWGVEIPNFETEGIGEEDAVKAVEEDDFDETAEEIHVRCKMGDVWQLGEHRLMCGDSVDLEQVKTLMGGVKATLVFTDPPYGMKKEKDGVMNDNLNYDDLLEFNKKWIPITFANLTENGSWYCWGIDEPLMDIYSNILKPMMRSNKITFRNYITWAKHSAFGVNSSLMRSYPRETEKCLFVMKGVEGFNNNADHFNDAYSKLLDYMTEEAKKVGLNGKMLTEICGVQMYSHWFTKSQFTPIPEKHLNKLRDYYKGQAFNLSYEEMQVLIGESSDEFKDLKQAVLRSRAYFDNEHNDTSLNDIMTDVWRYSVTSAKEKEMCGNHATPKPLALCARGIKSSSREGDIVLDVFGGSGSTLIACEQLGRKARLMELDPHYCDVIIARWEKLTGKTAEKIE